LWRYAILLRYNPAKGFLAFGGQRENALHFLFPLHHAGGREDWKSDLCHNASANKATPPIVYLRSRGLLRLLSWSLFGFCLDFVAVDCCV
jgi:hypothetical protein